MTHNKYCLYTCISGKYDGLCNYKCYDDEFDYYCFTDNPDLIQKKKLGHWNILPVDITNCDPTRINRYYKILGYKEYFSDYVASIYIDANISIETNYIYTLTKTKNHGNKLLVPEYPYKKNPENIDEECDIYFEIERCIAENLDDRFTLKRMYDLLLDNSMPRYYGFCENNLLIRQHGDSNIDSIMDEWWYYIINYSKRDQASFTYVLWKNHIHIKEITIPNVRKNVNFRVYGHLKSHSSIMLLISLPYLIQSNYFVYIPYPKYYLIGKACIASCYWFVELLTEKKVKRKILTLYRFIFNKY